MTAAELVDTAANAMRAIDAEAKREIRKFILSTRSGDGAFEGPGNDGPDPYYSFFAAMTLKALDKHARIPIDDTAMARFAETADKMDLAHIRSIAGIAALTRGRNDKTDTETVRRLADFAAKDGGFHHARRSAAESTPYGIFLALAAAADLDAEHIARASSMADIIETKNDAWTRRTVATETAAILAVMAKAKRADSKRARQAIDALQSLARPDGGFAASKSIPFSDTLSTSAAVYALRVSKKLDGKQTDNLKSFIESVWNEKSGGFAAVPYATPDSEHTFHAILALGCLPL